MWYASLRIRGAMAFAFTTLLLGFIGLDLVVFGRHEKPVDHPRH